jgi:Mrp family chromosome partitioning ATPase
LADAPLLAANVEGVLFVVESSRTRTRAAIESINRLDASGARVLGALLTKSSERSGYGYYSYRYDQLSSRRGEDKTVLIAHQVSF